MELPYSGRCPLFPGNRQLLLQVSSTSTTPNQQSARHTIFSIAIDRPVWRSCHSFLFIFHPSSFSRSTPFTLFASLSNGALVCLPLSEPIVRLLNPKPAIQRFLDTAAGLPDTIRHAVLCTIPTYIDTTSTRQPRVLFHDTCSSSLSRMCAGRPPILPTDHLSTSFFFT